MSKVIRRYQWKTGTITKPEPRDTDDLTPFTSRGEVDDYLADQWAKFDPERDTSRDLAIFQYAEAHPDEFNPIRFSDEIVDEEVVNPDDYWDDFAKFEEDQ